MKKTEIDRKFDAIVAFAEVERFLDTPVKRYSSGMYVRLAFAVAAHLEPEILIVDEVLAVGDAGFQKKCIGKMSDVAGHGRTVIFVSHNMGAIADLCHRCVWLDHGTVKATGPVEEAIHDYLTQTRSAQSATYVAPQGDAPMSDDMPAVLREAHLLSAKEQPTGHLRFGEPFAVEMVWEQSKAIPSVSYTVRFFDAQDHLQFAVNTIGIELDACESKGVHRLRCAIDNNVLVPGDYRVEVSAWVRPHFCVGLVENCLAVTVDESAWSHDNRFTIQGNPRFAPKSRWELAAAT